MTLLQPVDHIGAKILHKLHKLRNIGFRCNTVISFSVLFHFLLQLSRYSASSFR
jgi:hypothetical protein